MGVRMRSKRRGDEHGARLGCPVKAGDSGARQPGRFVRNLMTEVSLETQKRLFPCEDNVEATCFVQRLCAATAACRCLQ